MDLEKAYDKMPGVVLHEKIWRAETYVMILRYMYKDERYNSGEVCIMNVGGARGEGGVEG